tara:strand:- start:267 stop:707 length:441 start_codon:yes stop_codon:yes gene_type:complete
MTRKLSVMETFHKHGELWSDVEYGPQGFVFLNRNPSDKRRGVYAFVSQYGIEKVGKIENAKGIAIRTYQYSRCTLLRDASDILWDNAMTGELKDETLEFYFIHIPDAQEVVCGISLETAPIRALELELSKMARGEDSPMRLSGAGN